MKLRTLSLGLALAWIALPALAHAFLERASPAAGENVRSSPAKIELHFSEALEGAFSSIAVTDSAGLDMSAGPSVANGSALSLPLKNLKPGRYRVSWHAVSIDTHRSEGKYNFLVAPK
jgi:methionine-rich copper-binding protein CopC